MSIICLIPHIARNPAELMAVLTADTPLWNTIPSSEIHEQRAGCPAYCQPVAGILRPGRGALLPNIATAHLGTFTPSCTMSRTHASSQVVLVAAARTASKVKSSDCTTLQHPTSTHIPEALHCSDCSSKSLCTRSYAFLNPQTG